MNKRSSLSYNPRKSCPIREHPRPNLSFLVVARTLASPTANARSLTHLQLLAQGVDGSGPAFLGGVFANVEVLGNFSERAILAMPP